jgi:hypothetical protein
MKTKLINNHPTDLQEYLWKQRLWSTETFGEGKRTQGLTKHISSELNEILESPDDLMEWIDVMILALDGYWRAGGDPDNVLNMLIEKQDKNIRRTWKKVAEDQPSFHVKADAKMNGIPVTDRK